MFRRLDADAGDISFRFNDTEIVARHGDSIAAALLASGLSAIRATPVSGASRAPFCMMGVCFDCLVEIDGVGNRQACLTPARNGMIVRSQTGARNLF